ncbi:MAG: TRAP transporter large permease subunit, partial [Tepidimonas sp.]|nr:TRAP transporter large permease subunit [Tepidimonas sp.]
NRLLKLGLLSRLAEQVTFVLIPPLVLIFLVLGTIFLGVATPTEGGAMGAVGALIMAALKRRLSWSIVRQAMENSTKLSIFVLFILIGSTVFSFTFNAADGHVWVEHLFDQLPGGELGFLLVVNLLVFVLGFFIDFFEIAFIVVPLLAPVADKMGIDLIWFGVILAMNLQTSFLTPPFGFALFYLRSVAAREDYTDAVTGKRIGAVTTPQIYKGAVAFILLQLIMVAVVMAKPDLVTSNITKAQEGDTESARQQLLDMQVGDPDADDPWAQDKDEPGDGAEAGQDKGADGLPQAPADKPAEEDPLEALKRSMQGGKP